MKTIDKILTILENNRGNFISGEQIANKLQISRNAVWKSIKQLEESGYKIEAVRNKGYRLSEDSEQMSAIGIKEQLEETVKDRPIYYYETIDSTNKKAKELAIKGAEHGTCVVANEQTSGKGRYGRLFESPKNTGVYMSIILNPKKLIFEDPTIITSYAAVVVANVIKLITGKKVGIKWVNDLFLDKKKVCGILTEAVTNFENGQIDWIVLGIGINLSTTSRMFSTEIRHKVGSILNENDNKINRNQLVAYILSGILINEKEKTQKNIMDEYKRLSIVLNRPVLLQRGKEEFKALVEDIDEKGQLIVKKETGERITFNSGEIRILFQ